MRAHCPADGGKTAAPAAGGAGRPPGSSPPWPWTWSGLRVLGSSIEPTWSCLISLHMPRGRPLRSRRPGEHQPPHTHPTDEAVVIQQGCATFWLDARQARIARAGEVVRIPAGHVHTIKNTGDEPLHAAALDNAATVPTQPVSP